jgi:ribosome-binding factor A
MDVDLSADARNVKLYVDIFALDLEGKDEVIASLNARSNIHALKDLLAKKVNLRFVPEIMFLLDKSQEKISKINAVLEEEKRKYG